MKKIRLRSGTLPLLPDNKIILISSTKRKEFVLPKGGIEGIETPIQTALRETLEEAGITGVISNIEPFYKDSTCQWYLLNVNHIQTNWEEKNKRKRIFLSIKEILENKDKLIYTKTIKVIRKAIEKGIISE
ncbi:hypothetical protein CWI39_1864p0010 [Hamiltosporidium magnivora]|uniref:Nudix hydrolase domain-containing protein n=1 Tax=Hamiltosporidium magnivora TaxID=148818 RepID=A0A4Q9L042_9MICR|nr:hypothetical protein CWI39_1864p0010 [Hamiltosporidium magnivora]